MPKRGGGGGTRDMVGTLIASSIPRVGISTDLFRYFHSMLLVSMTILSLFLTIPGEGNFVLRACPRGGAL